LHVACGAPLAPGARRDCRDWDQMREGDEGRVIQE
jgi:hypothetical protein